MTAPLREMLSRPELIWTFASRDIRVKYKQSIMGLAWAILMPALIVGAGTLVRVAYAKISGEPFRFDDFAAVAVKSVPWAFFVASLRFGTQSLIGNRDLVTKIYLPRAIFPTAAVLSQGVDFLVGASVITVILAFGDIGASVQLVLLPVLALLLFALSLGLSIAFSAASLFFRDVKYLVEAVLTFAIFFTPVFYEAALFGRWEPLLLLNPVAPILEAVYSCVVLHAWPDFGWLAYSAVASLTILAAAFALFRRLEPAFAESI